MSEGGYFLGMKGIPKRQKRYFIGGEGISQDEISEIPTLGRVSTTRIYAPKREASYSHYPLGRSCMYGGLLTINFDELENGVVSGSKAFLTLVQLR